MNVYVYILIFYLGCFYYIPSSGGDGKCAENICESFTDMDDCNILKDHTKYPNGMINNKYNIINKY
jgi:hypothetical protein